MKVELFFIFSRSDKLFLISDCNKGFEKKYAVYEFFAA